MSSLPVYGANHAWSQYPLNAQPQLPIANDFPYATQSQPQQPPYPGPYQQYLQPSSNPDYQPGDTPPRSTPPGRQYSGPTSAVPPNQQIDPTYYPPPSLPTFASTSTPFLGPTFDLGHPNGIYHSSPQQTTSLSLPDGLTPEAVVMSSPPGFAYGAAASRPQEQYYSTHASSSVNAKRLRELDQSSDHDHGAEDDPSTESKDVAMKPKPSVSIV